MCLLIYIYTYLLILFILCIMTSKYKKAYNYYHNINTGNDKFGWERTEEDESTCCDMLWCIRKIVYYIF